MSILSGNCAYPFEIIPVIGDVDGAQYEYWDHVDGERHQEHEVESVVSSANAVIDPWTMMVECL